MKNDDFLKLDLEELKIDDLVGKNKYNDEEFGAY